MNFKELESSQKLSGSYYTPYWLADFIMRWVLPSGAKSILEPSCGEGVFFETMINRDDVDSSFSVLGLDINNHVISVCENKLKMLSANTQICNCDFLQWAIDNLNTDKPRTFDAAVGNPPFIRYQYWNQEFQDRAQKLFSMLGMKFSKHTNAWIPFVIASVKFLNAGGRLGMIIPSELLHVLYAKGLRDYLLQECSKILLIDPKERWFENTLQSVMVIMAQKKTDPNEKSKGVAIVHTQGKLFAKQDPIELFNQAEYTDGDFLQNKWTYALLTPKERKVYQKLCRHPKVFDFAELATADVGIVTGANKFFLVSDNTVEKYGLQEVAFPMFGRSEHCPGIIYDEVQHNENKRKNFPTNFLYFSKDEDNITYRTYFAEGEKKGLPKRYKCRIRTPWYKIPSVFASPISMLKRSNGMPRLILNRLEAYTTDTAYRIFPAEKIKSENLVICFLNTLTALSAELEGRHYGGGVLELVPSEIDRLKIPYCSDLDINIEKLNSFVKEHTADEVLFRQDQLIFPQIGISKEEIGILNIALVRIKNRRQHIAGSED